MISISPALAFGRAGYGCSEIRRVCRLVKIFFGVMLALTCSRATMADKAGQEECRSYGSLVITWAGVVDNGEGNDPPHGPIGSLHILVYEPGVPDPGDCFAYDAPLTHVYLSGPTSGGGDKREWLDGDEKTFENLEVFRWRKQNDAVSVLIYESDPSSATFHCLGTDFTVEMKRKHDRLFYTPVSRLDTVFSPLTLSSGTVRLALSDALQNVNSRESCKVWIQRVCTLTGWNMPAWEKPLDKAIPAMFVTFNTAPPDTPTTQNYR